MVPLVARMLVMVPLVAERTDAKSDVVVAFEVVALSAVKFCKVVEAKVMSPPQNCDACVVEVQQDMQRWETWKHEPALCRR